MKTLLKLIIGIVSTVLILAIILVVGVFIAFSNSEDKAPIDLYTEDVDIATILEPKLEESLKEIGSTYSLDLNFTEDDINKLVYSLIRSSLNESYNPKTGTTDEELYINSDIKIPDNVPVVGGKKLVVKNAYVEVENDTLTFNITLDAFGFLKSKLTVGTKFRTTDNEYVLEITELKIGKINLLGGLGKSILNMLIKNNAINIDSINAELTNKNIPFTIDLSNLTINCSKEKLGLLIKEKVVAEGDYADVFNDFASILTDPANNIINIGLSNDSLSLQANLNCLSVEEDKLILDEKVKESFDSDLFIKNKTQTFAINYLSTPEKKMTFTYDEFNQLLYNQTNNYSDFAFNIEITSNVTVNFKVEGITLNGNGEELYISIILNIGGLKTLGVVTCDVVNVSDEEIHLVLNEQIILGNDLSISSSFLNSIFAKFLNDSEILKFDEDNNYFVITNEIFSSFVSEASTDSTLTVSKIDFTTAGLEIFVEFADPTLESSFTAVTDHLKTVLENEFIDKSKFVLEDEKQEEAINNTLSAFEDVSAALTDPEATLTDELTSELVTNISNLSQENQTILLEQIQEQFTDEDLENLTTLYNSIFG